jgi:hypothetical protein
MQKLVFMLILSLLTMFASHANAASVYIATNSRTYHCDRNCPELNTVNVIEFDSPEEADVVGAIPCGHCKLTTGKPNYNTRNVLPNPVITNGSLGEFRHGTFPSPPLGEFTHVGVDLIAPCGSDIYSFADGQVKDVIDNTNDKNYSTLGYMILIEHPASLIGKNFYTLYLHMQSPPEVKMGDPVSGGNTVIGKVGDSGNTVGSGCHTHFEIRYSPGRFSEWNNIYGPGDKRSSEYFKQNWENPLTFFKKYPTGLKLAKSNAADTNEGVYVGDLENGKKNGYGTYTWLNGKKYVGEFKDDRMHGQGTLIWSSGNEYVGEFKNGTIHGEGTKTWTNGNKYIGEWKNYKMHGQGIYTWHSGGKYVGEWKDGMKSGQGTKTWPNGAKYVGGWKEDKTHGQGTSSEPDGRKYIGERKDNHKHGQGTLTWVTGEKYVGEWKDSKKHGQGTFTWPSGSKYVGGWKNDKRHGQGTYIYDNGEKYVGEMREDERHGQGTYIYASGAKYVGEWKDSKKHGQGIMTSSDGTINVGVWKNDKWVSSKGENIISKYSKQTSVFSTKNSRTYHMRNCSELNTDDLIRFGSPQKADSAGAIPCKGCNPSDIVIVGKKVTYSSGDKYEGEFKGGKRNGQGTYTWAEDGKLIDSSPATKDDRNPISIIGKWEYDDGIIIEFCKDSSLFTSLLGTEIKTWYKINGDIIESRESFNFSVPDTFYKILELTETTFKFIRTDPDGRKTTYNTKRILPQYSRYYSSITFSLLTCGNGGKDTNRSVRGDIPLSIDLSNKTTTDQILADALLFAEEECPVNVSHDTTSIRLYQTDDNYPEMDDAVISAVTYLGHIRTPHWNHFKNHAASRTKIKKETERKKKKEKEAKKRFNEFCSKNRVESWVSMDELCANPFVYQGKTIAIRTFFAQMVSATSGIFIPGGFEMVQHIVVSNIPKGLFTSSDEASIIIVGEVLGKTESTVPILGSMQVPHLKFIDYMLPGK